MSEWRAMDIASSVDLFVRCGNLQSGREGRFDIRESYFLFFVSVAVNTDYYIFLIDFLVKNVLLPSSSDQNARSSFEVK